MMTSKQLLTIATSTMNDGLRQLILPEPHPEISHIVVVQEPPKDWSEILSNRRDVEIIPMNGRGLSRSRNRAIVACRTPIMLVADDDLVFNIEACLEGARRLAGDADIDFLAGILGDTHGAPRHLIPEIETIISRKSTRDIWSPELMIKTGRVREADVAFSPLFGLGALWPACEEALFALDMLDAGLVGLSSPIMFSEHEGETTGERRANIRIMEAQVRVAGAKGGISGGIRRKVRKLIEGARGGLPFTDLIQLAACGHGRGPRPLLSEEIRGEGWTC